MAVGLIVSLLLGAFIAFYYWTRSKSTYFERLGILSKEPTFLYGNLKIVGTEIHISHILKKFYEEYKNKAPVHGLYELLMKPTFVVTDLNLIKDILIKDFDNFRKRGIYHTEDDVLSNHLFHIEDEPWKIMRNNFSPIIHHNLELFFNQWDRMSNLANGGYSQIDALPWFNYLAFDIIGDLAFGAPFGMLEKGKDIVEVRKSPDASPSYVPAIDVLNRRGEVSGTLGCLPSLIPYAKYFPDTFFSKGLEAVENLTGIAVARVKERLANAENIDRVDLLARLMEGKDENGEKLGREELTAEALTQLIAGSDTTSNTSCALLFHTLKNPKVIKKLQKELSYLDFVIKETMRVHSTSSLGLPRVVVGDGVTLHGHFFPPGTILSVPPYTIHHLKEIWGPDADSFRPERWASLTERQKKAFIPFSYGPRACVGRNVAEMEMALITGTIFRNFEFQLEQDTLETREGFLRKPLFLNVGMRRRKI